MKYRDAEDRTVFNDPETTAIELDRGRRARSALELSAAASAHATGGSEKTVFRG
jgi:hypothetical protein